MCARLQTRTQSRSALDLVLVLVVVGEGVALREEARGDVGGAHEGAVGGLAGEEATAVELAVVLAQRLVVAHAHPPPRRQARHLPRRHTPHPRHLPSLPARSHLAPCTHLQARGRRLLLLFLLLLLLLLRQRPSPPRRRAAAAPPRRHLPRQRPSRVLPQPLLLVLAEGVLARLVRLLGHGVLGHLARVLQPPACRRRVRVQVLDVDPHPVLRRVVAQHAVVLRQVRQHLALRAAQSEPHLVGRGAAVRLQALLDCADGAVGVRAGQKHRALAAVLRRGALHVRLERRDVALAQHRLIQARHAAVPSPGGGRGLAGSGVALWQAAGASAARFVRMWGGGRGRASASASASAPRSQRRGAPAAPKSLIVIDHRRPPAFSNFARGTRGAGPYPRNSTLMHNINPNPNPTQPKAPS
eukprot:scaffold1211_cov337-Prasinococcus_capsulatus_cf.AAC.2